MTVTVQSTVEVHIDLDNKPPAEYVSLRITLDGKVAIIPPGVVHAWYELMQRKGIWTGKVFDTIEARFPDKEEP